MSIPCYGNGCGINRLCAACKDRMRSGAPVKIDIYQTLADALNITRREAKELVLRQIYSAEPNPNQVLPSDIADKTWRQGFVHLTVDGFGLVSLWDEEQKCASYLKLPLTDDQRILMEMTMAKGGYTP